MTLSRIRKLSDKALCLAAFDVSFWFATTPEHCDLDVALNIYAELEARGLV